MLMVWFERKVIADMQNRIGPNRAGPFGHPADAGRRHQAVLQGGPDPRHAPTGCVFRLAPYLSFVPAFLVFAIVPVGGDFSDGKTASSRSSATTPTCSSPTRRSASCSLLAMSVDRRSTASCSPAGRRARSTRCSARCGRRRRWSATRPRSGSPSPRSCCVSRARSATQRHRRRARRRHRRSWNVVAHRRSCRSSSSSSPRTAEIEPPAVRPRRGRAGARRRLQHRVHRHPLRALLPRRVHEHDHDVGDHRHAVPRWPDRPGARSGNGSSTSGSCRHRLVLR